MKQLQVNIFQYNDLPQKAKKTVIQDHIESGWYDYSEHDKVDFKKSLEVFNTAFNTIGGAQAHGDDAQKLIISGIHQAARIQAKNNEFYAKSFENKFNSEVKTVEAAIELMDNCVFTGVFCDFYLTDTLVEYLKGEKYQKLSFADLLHTARKNGYNELRKTCRSYTTINHVDECLKEQCEDWFLKDGSPVPKSILDEAA